MVIDVVMLTVILCENDIILNIINHINTCKQKNYDNIISQHYS